MDWWMKAQLIVAVMILIFGVLKTWHDIRHKKSSRNVIGDILVPLILAFLVGIDPVIQLLQPSEIKKAIKPLVNNQDRMEKKIDRILLGTGEPLRYEDGIPQSDNLNLRKLYEEGIRYSQNLEPDKAIKAFRTALVLKDLKPSESASLLVNIGVVQYRQNNWDEAMGSYQEALNWAKRAGDSIGQAIALLDMGLVHESKGEFAEAIQTTQEALTRFEKLLDEYSVAQAYGNLGVMYNRNREFDKAKEYHVKALREFEKLKDKYGQTQILTNLGTFYFTKHLCDSAIVFYDSSLKIADQIFIIKDKIEYLRGNAQTYGDLGIAYYCLGEWNRAEAYYDTSLRGFEEINDSLGIAITKADIALLYKTQGKKKEAKKLFEEVLKFFEGIGDKPSVAITRKHLKDL